MKIVFDRRSRLLTLVALLAAGVLLLLLAAPPAPQSLQSTLPAGLAARTVAGAYHVHTTRSDGIGDRDVVAKAAARVGMTFVILTDHGDGTRPPDPAAYLHGVLVLEGVEISTDQGHYVAIDMAPAPYPLGGAAASVVEDVTRLGGFGFAAHPDSPKSALRWTDQRSPIDGIEWLNTDSEWRDEPRTRIARAGIAYFLRGGPAVASLFDRPVTLDRWNGLTKSRPVVALAGADAHGGVGRRAEDPGRSVSGMIGIPSYLASFQAFSNRVVLDRPLGGNAAADARAVLDAIREGRVFTAIDALAGPAVLDFHVEVALERAEMGGVLPEDSDATLVARASMPRDAGIFLLRDGREIARGRDEIRRGITGARGAYRVEIRIPGAPGAPPIPWLVSNPIYFGGASKGDKGGGAEAGTGAQGAQAAVPPFPWRIEKDITSSGILRTTARAVALEFKLGDGARNSQFVALATDLQRQDFRTIDLSLAGDRPMRVLIQVRRGDGERWGRSIYVDPAGGPIRVPLASLEPITASAGSVASGPDVTSILLVVDLTNAAPGRAGTLRILASALSN